MKRKDNWHHLENVIDYFLKGYKIKKDEYIYRHEYFLDPVKKQICITLWLDKKEKEVNF